MAYVADNIRRASDRKQEKRFKDELDSLRAENSALRVELKTHKLALEAVAWYFDQRRYSISEAGDRGYYAHDTAHRYAKKILQSDGSDTWPSVYMALCAARTAAAGEDGSGES